MHRPFDDHEATERHALPWAEQSLAPREVQKDAGIRLLLNQTLHERHRDKRRNTEENGASAITRNQNVRPRYRQKPDDIATYCHERIEVLQMNSKGCVKDNLETATSKSGIWDGRLKGGQ